MIKESVILFLCMLFSQYHEAKSHSFAKTIHSQNLPLSHVQELFLQSSPTAFTPVLVEVLH